MITNYFSFASNPLPKVEVAQVPPIAFLPLEAEYVIQEFNSLNYITAKFTSEELNIALDKITHVLASTQQHAVD